MNPQNTENAHPFAPQHFFAARNWGVAKLVKAPDFDSGIRGFESFLPSQNIPGQTQERN